MMAPLLNPLRENFYFIFIKGVAFAFVVILALLSKTSYFLVGQSGQNLNVFRVKYGQKGKKRFNY